MKKLIRGIGLLLVSVFMFASCSDKNQNEVDNTLTSNNNYNQLVRDDYVGPGIHQAEYEDSGKNIIERGKSNYKILIPKNACDYEIKGAQLIQTYLFESTHVRIPIVESTGNEKNGEPYISLGDTALMRNSGIAVPYSELDSDGFKIVTKGETVYISGARTNGTRAGTYYGAQDFLKHTINWRAYTDVCVYYDKMVTVKLHNYNIVEVPDFKNRIMKMTSVSESETWADYTRSSMNSVEELPFDGHSHFTILPPDVYYEKHPDWYTHKDGEAPATTVNADTHQLCWSNEEMAKEFAYQLAERFFEYPQTNFANLGFEDNNQFCHCSQCEKYISEVTLSGLQVMFTNKVARQTQELIHQVQPNRNIYVQAFAYSYTLPPPVKKVDGKWVALSNDAIPDSNVYIRFAPLGMNTSEVLSDVINQEYNDYFEGWCAISEKISAYIYAINFSWIMINHKNWDTVETILRQLADGGVDRIIDQGSVGYYMNTLPELRIWVESKLMWDLSLNYDALVKEFIMNFYGEASEEIQEMWNLMTAQNEYSRTELGMSGWHRLMLSDTKYWSFTYVESIRKIMESAFEEIEPLKTSNPKEYETLYWRLSTAYYENLWMQLELYRSEYSESYVLDMIDYFQKITDYRNSIQVTEYASDLISVYINKWRDSYA